MKVLGITGGIGMGKSMAGRLLQELGFPVTDTDTISHQLVEPGQPALQEIATAFGKTVLDEAGALRRDELARIVFGNASSRQKLESILHPRIRETWQAQVQSWRSDCRGAGFVLIPLLFETNAAADFDAVICLGCSAATQRARMRERGWSDDHIAQRLAAQWPLHKKIDASNFVVWTDTTVEIHRAQLTCILKQL